jgi:hypothetical protein
LNNLIYFIKNKKTRKNQNKKIRQKHKHRTETILSLPPPPLLDPLKVEEEEENLAKGENPLELYRCIVACK